MLRCSAFLRDGWSSDAVVIDYLLEQSSWNRVCVKSDPLSHAVLFHCPRQAQSAQLSPAQRKQSVYTPPTMRGTIYTICMLYDVSGSYVTIHHLSHSCYAVPFELLKNVCACVRIYGTIFIKGCTRCLEKSPWPNSILKLFNYNLIIFIQ